MLRLRMFSIPAALLVATGVAGAQHTPGAASGQSTPPTPHPSGTTPRAATVSSNGIAPRWGGSPPDRTHDARRGQFGQQTAFIPIAVAAPYPVPAYADPSCPPDADASVQMPVITTHHEDRQLTTIEVYRLQPRFQKP